MLLTDRVRPRPTALARLARVVKPISLLLAFCGLCGPSAASTPLSMDDIAEQASAGSRAQQTIERLPDGRVMMRVPMQDIEAIVDLSGTTVRSVDEAGEASFHWRLSAIGRPGARLPQPSAGHIRVERQRVSVIRPESAEEFSVDADGLRQDVLVLRRPRGAGGLEVELEAQGAEVTSGSGDDILRFRMIDGRELVYHALHVIDARGATLPARMEALGSSAVRIHVDDSSAAYPIRIDPTFADLDWSVIEGGVFDGEIHAVSVGGSRLFVAGSFTRANGGVEASRIASWNGSVWSPVGGAIDGSVYALEWDQARRHLYVGGSFQTIDGVPVRGVAVWDGANWSDLSGGVSGLHGAVYDLDWDAGNRRLYVAGSLTRAGDVVVNHVAVWDGTSWAAFGSGLDQPANAVVWDAMGGRLYVAGIFTVAGGVVANRIAAWDGASWSALGSGANYAISDLAWDASVRRLYAGGVFTEVGGIQARHVASWDGSSWSALGGGTNNSINALALDPSTGNLYVGGFFTMAGSVPANRVAVWTGAAWGPLASGTNDSVANMAWNESSGSLFSVGRFTTAGGVAARQVAVWKDSKWSALGEGMSSDISAMAWDGDERRLYVGGSFSSAGGVAANRIAVWNGSEWSALGSGLDGAVLSLAWDAAGRKLYAGGRFDSAGGMQASRVARWDGRTWSALGDGLNGHVHALAWDAGDQILYAGGGFGPTPGSPASRVAAWDGQRWLSLGSGLNGTVRAIALDAVGRRVFVAGDFTATNAGTPLSRVASWDGSSWSALGGGVNGSATALAWDAAESQVFVGGLFDQAGGRSTGRVASWDGTTWLSLGNGPAGQQVSALVWDAISRRLIAGGFFVDAGGAEATNLVLWDGSSWASMGSATNSGFFAMAWDPESQRLFAGGRFTTANGRPARVLQAQFTTAQAISFVAPTRLALGTSLRLSAVASSGLPVTFTSTTPNVCSIGAGSILSLANLGECVVHADQAGNLGFLPAPRVTRVLSVEQGVPGSPAIGTATAGDARARVTFSPPASDGGASITGYTVTSHPGDFIGTGASSPITVSGLTNGMTYTFTVRATNSAGTSPPSAPSNSVTPRAAVATPVLRPDRAVVRENSGEVRIDVLANDNIDPTLLGAGALSIIEGPTRGTASVSAFAAAGLQGDVIAYTPARDTSGADSLRYRVCFGGATPCVDTTVSIEVRPLDDAGIALNVDSDRGRRDVALSGLRALPAARFDAHGLVAPVVITPSLSTDATPETPFDAGGASTTLRTLAANASARTWRVFVDARSLSGGDVDVYLGLDANANGQADSSEVACAAAMSAVAERCELAVSQAANQAASYWVLLHSRSGAQNTRAELFEVPLDRPAVERQLAATGPGALAANASFDLRLVWNDATLAPGQVRGGWLEVKSDANTSLGWVPVRIERSAGAAVPFALQSGIDHALALAASAANEGLYIDVPPGMTRLDVTTTSASNVDLYLARVDAPVASAATPSIPAAPARHLAAASAATPSGNESLTVANPPAGRWYVTPVNASGATVEAIVRATLGGTGPQLRPGGFYNPLRSGTGLFLYPSGPVWAGLWYTYLQDGTPTWYYLQAAAPGPTGLWRGRIFRSAWNGGSNFLTPVGEATVTPTAAHAFTFSYTLEGESGSEAYETFGGGCPTFAGAPLDVSGHWFDPARAGSGYSVQLFPNYEFYTVFGYDAQGVPRYLVAERNGIGAATTTLDLAQNTGACPLCTRSGNPVRTTVGSLTRTFGNGTLQSIQLNGRYTAGVPGTWAANDAVTPLGSLQGCATN